MAYKTDPLNPTIDIEDPEFTGVFYRFKTPSIAEKLTMDAKARYFRAKYDPEGNGSAVGMPTDAFAITWSMAAIETLLVHADAKWVFGLKENEAIPNDRSPFPVDSSKFPDDQIDKIMWIGNELSIELARFRKTWPRRQKPADKETVDSGKPA